ncbi:MAG: multidrug ABC transporter substrate-binding protein [Ignavibacteriae bacterium HGW-Ignavibacteriae-2]|jgi:putative ABC transport system permease protein|nr:ABC transporter permease [Bacteroidota bacterium]PKL89197.1 MAG: multidrug ABC transporter substrate-binding protein [Ignavibacteriae bacterium HGW-Ignavibacteriae-2]
MQAKIILKVAVKSIMKSRMRSLLTALGIIIGVAAVVVMVAVGDGAQLQVENQIASLGSNLIIITPGTSTTGGVRGGAGSFNRFTFDDVDKIKNECLLINGVSPLVRSGGQIIGGIGNWFTQVQGVSPDYLEIRAWDLQSGEFFSDRDVMARSKVCVLGSEVVKNLFPNDDPIGQQIRIRNVPFKVIGVLKEKGQTAVGTSNDDVILAPSKTVLDRLSGGRFISSIQVSAVSADKIPEAIVELKSIMRESHKLSPGEEDDFTIRDQADLSEAATETSRILTILLASVAGVSLIVGGIGIMNIMLVSVTERTREIGIRLSVGARASDILIQFLTEAIVLSLSGGAIGVLLSFFIAYLLNNYTSQSAFIKPEVIMIAFGFAGAIGVFFGFYPARKAAALNPIDALRYE